MSLPIEIVARNLQLQRQKIGLSLTEVARRAGIAKSTLSQLEAAQGNPSLETLWALCVVLHIPFAQLMQTHQAKTQVIRFGEGPSVVSEVANYRAILLADSPVQARRDVYILTVQPGKPRLSEPHTLGSIEHIIIMKGSAKVGLVREAITLNEGDYICYPADEAHIFEALVPDTLAILISEQS